MKFRDVTYSVLLALTAISPALFGFGLADAGSTVGLPPASVVDTSSLPRLDTKHYVNEPGTMAPGTACTTAALSTPHANPILATASTRCRATYLDSAVVDYRALVRASADAIVLSNGDFPAQSAPSELGAVIHPKTAKEDAAGVTVVNHAFAPGNVLRYGPNSIPGTTDMTVALQAAIDSNSSVYVPAAVYRITTSLALVSDLTLYGDGAASVISAAADIDVIRSANKKNIILRDFAINGAPSTVATDAIHLSGSSNIQVLRLEISGVSDQGVMATAGSSKILVQDSYFHDWQNKVADSADISFYNNVVDSKAIDNRCEGGGDHGIRFQLGSNRNLADGNTVGAHARYGILAGYEATTPAVADNVITNNHIRNITGLGLISGQARAGAGIYSVLVGGLIIRNNTVQNTNINTAVETLTPAAIAIAAPYSASLIEGNSVQGCHWYGIGVFSNTYNAPVTVLNNAVADCAKIGIYAKNFGNITVKGNQVTNTATAAVDGIVAYGQGAKIAHVQVVENWLRGGLGGMVNGIRLENVNDFLVSGNHVEGPQGRGLDLITSDDGAIEQNTVRSAVTSGLRFSQCSRVIATGGYYHSVGTYSVESSRTGVGNLLKDANLIPFVARNAAGSGLTIIGRHPTTPTSGTWAEGDTVYYAAPTPGADIGAVCMRAGTPGTWKPFGPSAP